nr:HPr family phosphocarrier protein [uncultured Oscillibacter sp.]
MVSAKTKVINPQGLHMRPAQLFVSELAKYNSDVTIVFNGKSVNGKSIMHLMAACIKQGSELEIRCEGEQEAEALKAAVALVEAGLGDL